MDYQSVLNDVESLPVGDRIRLVHEVWDRLEEEGHDLELSDEMKAELDRRVEEMRLHPELGVPWEEVKARITKRLGK